MLREELQKYRCWVFDCDGVLLDSNRAKTEAFYDVAKPYGHEAALALKTYHMDHGGISRFVKFRHFFTGILQRGAEPGEMEALVDAFARVSRQRLLDCDQAPRLEEVMAAVGERGSVYIVSGSAQDELRDVFRLRGLDHYFTAIFGSPDSKDTIFTRERAQGAMPEPTLFVGDARYDAEMAERHGLDFAFATRWSEFHDWPSYFAGKPILVVDAIADLLKP